MVKYVKHTYPKVKILARAFDRGHNYLLRQAGADYIESETFHSALEMGTETLRCMGLHPFHVEQQRNTYLKVENESSDKLYKAWLANSEEERFDNNYRKLFMELEQNVHESMNVDRSDKHSRTERGWTPPPKGYADEFTDE